MKNHINKEIDNFRPLQAVELEKQSQTTSERSVARKKTIKSQKSKQQAPIRKKRKSSAGQKQKKFKDKKRMASDEALAVIQDQRNGQTFYISLIDNFTFKGREYTVMYNYRAEDYAKSMPEILIMRTYRDNDKQYFTSIRDKSELDMIFNIFYDRFQQST